MSCDCAGGDSRLERVNTEILGFRLLCKIQVISVLVLVSDGANLRSNCCIVHLTSLPDVPRLQRLAMLESLLDHIPVCRCDLLRARQTDPPIESERFLRLEYHAEVTTEY